MRNWLSAFFKLKTLIPVLLLSRELILFKKAARFFKAFLILLPFWKVLFRQALQLLYIISVKNVLVETSSYLGSKKISLQEIKPLKNTVWNIKANLIFRMRWTKSYLMILVNMYGSSLIRVKKYWCCWVLTTNWKNLQDERNWEIFKKILREYLWEANIEEFKI